MSRTLVIPDVHHRTREMDAILRWEEPYDRVVWTGDYQDGWGDTVEDATRTALWLQSKLADPRNVMLLGNHDTPYRWPTNGYARCSGFTQAKALAVKDSGVDLTQLRSHYSEAGVLFTHAGLDLDLLPVLGRDRLGWPAGPLTVQSISDSLSALWPGVVQRYSDRSCHPLLEAGRDRGGDQSVGGITWRDFSWHNPIPGVGQICGHTIQDKGKGPLFRLRGKDGAPTWRHAFCDFKPEWLAGGWTLCLDTESRHYAMIETDETGQESVLIIKSVNWVKHPNPSKGGEIVAPGREILTVKLPEQSDVGATRDSVSWLK